MKREIKFRAWTGSKMLYNVGSHPFMTFRLDAYDILNKEEEGYTEGENLITNPQIIDMMQFTGLRDKNGKEIYEGDVVRFQYDQQAREEVVLWIDGSLTLGYCISLRNTQTDHYRTELEVIGNIYEKPELLEPRNAIEAAPNDSEV